MDKEKEVKRYWVWETNKTLIEVDGVEWNMVSRSDHEESMKAERTKREEAENSATKLYWEGLSAKSDRKHFLEKSQALESKLKEKHKIASELGLALNLSESRIKELEAKVKELEQENKTWRIVNQTFVEAQPDGKNYLKALNDNVLLESQLATAKGDLEQYKEFADKVESHYLPRIKEIELELSTANKKAEKLVGAVKDALELVKLIKGGYGYSLQGFNDTFEQALKEFRGEK